MTHQQSDDPTPGPEDTASGRAFAPHGDPVVAGVGIDVVGIARLAEMLERTPALVDRLLTPSERDLSDASRAARVAAKEAVGKALGAPGDFSWQEVTVERTAAHRPYLRLRGATLACAEALGVEHLHLSLSHDGDMATAIVVAERARPDPVPPGFRPVPETEPLPQPHSPRTPWEPPTAPPPPRPPSAPPAPPRATIRPVAGRRRTGEEGTA